MTGRHVAVVGGCLAGLAAAARLEGRGARVTLLGSGEADEPASASFGETWNDVHLTGVASQSTLLFKDTAGFSGERGTGVWASPPDGGTFRDTGGQFVHIAGRPYRMNHADLRQNVEFILENYLDEPYVPVSAVPGEGVPGAAVSLAQNVPNPFNPSTNIRFALTEAGPARLRIFDVSGRLVRTLIDRPDMASGAHEARWDGTDHAGRAAAAGVYFYRLETADSSRTRRMTLVK